MDVDDRIEQVGGQVVKGLVAEDAGVVDDDVDAVEGVERGLYHRFATSGGRNAVAVGDRLAAEVADFPGDRLCRSGVGALAVDRTAEIVDHHARAARGQQQGVLPAQPSAGAGHDRDLPVKSEICHGRRG